jgi:hypothetical protein
MIDSGGLFSALTHHAARRQGVPMKRSVVLLALAFSLGLTSNTWAQFEDSEAIRLTRSAVQAERQAIIAANLQLNETERAVFWPLYQEYRDALDAAINTRVELLNQFFASYETLTDKEAVALLQQHLAWKQEVLEIRTKHAKKMSKALSGRTVAKFFQIENKMDIIVEYEMAGEIPLIK